jgi:probable rRNA maturation factor
MTATRRAKSAKPGLPEWQARAERALDRVLRATELTGPFPRDCARAGRRAEVKVVGAAAMRRLNREYRGKDRPTDVLSFSAPAVFRRQGVLGELVVCLPVLRLQARRLGHAERTELLVLLAHGALHLLGLDHERGAREERAMARAETRLLNLLLGRLDVPARCAGLIERTR